MHPRSPEQEHVLKHPSTPTSSSLYSTSNKYLKTPSTVSTQHKSDLYTPKTPHHGSGAAGAKKQLLSPIARPHQQQLQTPDQTPRHNRRKELADAISFGSIAGPRLNHGSVLFPLAHSTVGSGRRLSNVSSSSTSSNNNNKLNLSNLDMKGSFKIALEEELLYSSEEETNNLTKITKKLEFDVPSAPSTPKGQIMNEQLAYDLNIKEVNMEEDDFETKITRKELSNPFIDDHSSKPSLPKEDYSRFENEIELIHSKTGKKIVQQLDDYQKSIKPRKLVFDAMEGDGVDIKMNTPTTPTNKIQLNPLNEKYDDLSDDLDDGELIRKEKIRNPFKVPVKQLSNNANFNYRRRMGTASSFVFGDLNSNINQEDSDMDSISKSNKVTNAEEMTEIVYINNKTGTKLVRKMDDEQLKIKSKKINFDNC